MKLGVDIDNVINDLGPLMKQKVKEHFGFDYTYNQLYKNYYLRDSLGISRWEEMWFWQKYGWELAQESQPKPFCRQALLWLKTHGFHIHLITARPLLMKLITESWLEKHQIPFDDIVYSAESKGDVCLQKKVHIMIEDADHNIIDLLQKGVKTIAIPYPYNAYIRHKKLVHIGDWRSISYFLFKVKQVKGA